MGSHGTRSKATAAAVASVPSQPATATASRDRRVSAAAPSQLQVADQPVGPSQHAAVLVPIPSLPSALRAQLVAYIQLPTAGRAQSAPGNASSAQAALTIAAVTAPAVTPQQLGLHHSLQWANPEVFEGPRGSSLDLCAQAQLNSHWPVPWLSQSPAPHAHPSEHLLQAAGARLNAQQRFLARGDVENQGLVIKSDGGLSHSCHFSETGPGYERAPSERHSPSERGRPRVRPVKRMDDDQLVEFCLIKPQNRCDEEYAGEALAQTLKFLCKRLLPTERFASLLLS